jgi:hypothetical protein
MRFDHPNIEPTSCYLYITSLSIINNQSFFELHLELATEIADPERAGIAVREQHEEGTGILFGFSAVLEVILGVQLVYVLACKILEEAGFAGHALVHHLEGLPDLGRILVLELLSGGRVQGLSSSEQHVQVAVNFQLRRLLDLLRPLLLMLPGQLHSHVL